MHAYFNKGNDIGYPPGFSGLVRKAFLIKTSYLPQLMKKKPYFAGPSALYLEEKGANVLDHDAAAAPHPDNGGGAGTGAGISHCFRGTLLGFQQVERNEGKSGGTTFIGAVYAGWESVISEDRLNYMSDLQMKFPHIKEVEALFPR